MDSGNSGGEWKELTGNCRNHFPDLKSICKIQITIKIINEQPAQHRDYNFCKGAVRVGFGTRSSQRGGGKMVHDSRESGAKR